jgi:hypothetical protein
MCWLCSSRGLRHERRLGSKANPKSVLAELVEAPREHSAMLVMGVLRQAAHRDELFPRTGSADQGQFGASTLTLERALRVSALQRLLSFKRRL